MCEPLQCLTRRQREVILIYLGEDRTVSDIATRLGRTERAVRYVIEGVRKRWKARGWTFPEKKLPALGRAISLPRSLQCDCL